MIVNNLTIIIDGYGNASMQDSRTEETVRILREIASKIEEYGVVNSDGTTLHDINGNSVGFVQVEWED